MDLEGLDANFDMAELKESRLFVDIARCCALATVFRDGLRIVYDVSLQGAAIETWVDGKCIERREIETDQIDQSDPILWWIIKGLGGVPLDYREVAHDDAD